MLAELIAAYVTEREEFQLNEGYQPTNSLFYILKGRFWCEIDQKEAVIEAGDVVIFNSEISMRRRVLEPLRFLYIKYSMKNASLFDMPSGVFRDLSPRASEDLKQIAELSEAHTPLSLRLQSHYLSDLLLSLLPRQTEHSLSRLNAAVPSTLDRPVAYLREHLTEKLSLDDLARASGMSVSSLEGKFKALTGASAYRYLITLRMERAMQLLRETAYSVTEIAARCGYDNLFYFCNAFKKQIGMTPTQFRERERI